MGPRGLCKVFDAGREFLIALYQQNIAGLEAGKQGCLIRRSIGLVA